MSASHSTPRKNSVGPKQAASHKVEQKRHSAKAHTAPFEEVCLNIHALLSRIGCIDRLRKAAKKRPHHPNYGKLMKKADEWENQLKAHSQNPADLLKKDDKDEQKVFDTLDDFNSDEVTLIELESAFTSAVRRLHITGDTILHGWTLPEIFRNLDVDCSGKISFNEWIARKQGKEWDNYVSLDKVRKERAGYTDEKMDKLMDEWEHRNEEDDATEAYKKKLAEEKAAEEKKKKSASALYMQNSAQDMLKEQFRKWDKNRMGFITDQQLCGLLKTLNPMFRDSDLKQIMKEVDTNGNGKIEYEEFVDFIFNQDEVMEKARKESILKA